MDNKNEAQKKVAGKMLESIKETALSEDLLSLEELENIEGGACANGCLLACLNSGMWNGGGGGGY